MTPRRITAMAFLVLIYGALYAITVGQTELAWTLGGVCLFLLVLYRTVCTAPLVFLSQAEDRQPH